MLRIVWHYIRATFFACGLILVHNLHGRCAVELNEEKKTTEL